MRLIWKLTFLGLIATFFSMVAFIIFSSFKSTSYIKNIVSDELIMDASFYADEVDHMIEMRLEDARTLAASPVFKNESAEDLDNYLRYISSGSMWIQEIAFYDSEWNLVAWPEKIEPKTFSMRSVVHMNMALIEDVKNTGKQKIFTFEDEKTGFPGLIVITPVYTADKPAYPYGFLALNLDFECILGCTGFFHHAHEKKRSFYVIDHNNRIVASMNGINETGEQFDELDGFDEIGYENVNKQIVEYASKKSGKSYMGAVSYLENLSDKHDIIWKVALVSPLDSVMTPVYSLAKVHIALGLIVTIFSITMSFFLARALTVPLNRIISMAAKMRCGEYTVRIPLETMSSEFELLTTTLNSMAEKVDERTTELIETNERLIEEVKSHEETRDALSGEEERFRLMVENLPLGSIYVENGKIYLNRAAEELTGYARNETSFDGFLDSVLPSRKDIEIYETKEVMSLNAFHGWKQCEIRTKNGGKRFAEVKAYRVEKGEVYILKDITEQIESDREKEEMQQQLYQAQKMEAIGQLAGGMAHDFNNMIGVIIGSASMALMDITEDAPGYKELKNIVEASRRARELSTKILTFARKEKVMVMSASPVEVVEASINMFKRAMPSEVSLGMSYFEGVPNVLIDAMQIEQVLINLFRNACDAMSGGGSIVVNIREADPEKEELNLPVDERYCVFEITDTGAGMPKEVAERIFEPFFTTKKAGKGTGLGLSVTMGIIRNHNGFIDVISKEGEGTTISIYIPIDKEWKAESSEAKLETPVDSNLIIDEIEGNGESPASLECKKEKILVVDDELMMKEVTVAILQSNGYRVVSAGNGNDALDVFKKRRNEIALVVMDIMMPVMDGIQAFLKLREIDPEIPVVFVSGYVEESYLMENAPEMVDYFVHKPYENDELLDKVALAISGVETS